MIHQRQDINFNCPDCGCTQMDYHGDLRCCYDCGLLCENFVIYVDDYTSSDSGVKITETKRQMIENYMSIHYSKHKDFKRALHLALLYSNNFKTGKNNGYVELIHKTIQYLDGCPKLEKDKTMKKLLALDGNAVFSSEDVHEDKIRQSCEELMDIHFKDNPDEERKRQLVAMVVHDYKNYSKLEKCPSNTPTCILASLIHYIWKTLHSVNIKAIHLGQYFNISEGNISNIKKKFILIKNSGEYRFGEFFEYKEAQKSLMTQMLECTDPAKRREILKQHLNTV